MGCDIHFVVERKSKGLNRWIGVWSSGSSPRFPSDISMAALLAEEPTNLWVYRNIVLKDRNYAFFAALAGVRGDGPDPAGLPEDVSELAQEESEAWDGDGHSHSWNTLYDFVHTWLSVAYPSKYMPLLMEAPTTALNLVDAIAGNYISTKPEYHEDSAYRVVYWFDS